MLSQVAFHKDQKIWTAHIPNNLRHLVSLKKPIASEKAKLKTLLLFAYPFKGKAFLRRIYNWKRRTSEWGQGEVAINSMLI